MRVLLGIGNPGPEYEGTRHNLGFEVADAIAREASARWVPVRGAEAAGCRVRVGGEELLVLKPLTYVNRCGPVLAAALRRLRLGPDRALVVVDDLALPLGRLRIRGGGSDGGHNGLRSLQAALGSLDFPRLRIGIGGPGGRAVPEYVLGRFQDTERPVADAAVERAVRGVKLWVVCGLSAAMPEVNRRVLDPDRNRP